jgi:hypothetical protein
MMQRLTQQIVKNQQARKAEKSKNKRKAEELEESSAGPTKKKKPVKMHTSDDTQAYPQSDAAGGGAG